MAWSKEVAEALAVLERAYGSFVLVARAPDMAGVLLHAHQPTRALVDDVDRWVKAYRATPPPGKVSLKYGQRPHDGRDVPRNADGYEIQHTDCPVPDCPVRRHIVGEMAVGMRVRTLAPRIHSHRDERSLNVPVGETGKIVEWSQYGTPLYYRVELDNVRDYRFDELAGWPALANYHPCELALVDQGCWIDGCGKPTRPAGGICESHERELAERRDRG